MARRRRHAMAYLSSHDPMSAALQYAEYLLTRAEEGETDLPSVQAPPPIESLALFGLDDEEWRDAVRAVRLQCKLDQLSEKFPLVTLSTDHVETDGVRVQLWSGQVFRPMVFEERLQVPISPSDLQVLMDSLGMLPSGWSLVVEVQRGTG